MSGSAHQLPGLAIAVGLGAALLAVIVLVWMVWHALRRLVDSPRVPMGGATYGFFAFICLLLAGVSAATFSIGRMLGDHARLAVKTRLGDVRCTHGADGKLRMVYSPVDGAVGSIGGASTTCDLHADLLTLRALPARLGMSTLVRVTNVGGVEPIALSPPWLRTDGERAGLPLALLIRDVHSAEVTAAPDDGAIYHLMASPDGLQLEKSGS